MNKTELTQAGRATVADLQSLAAQGVKRALDVRMSELSASQVQAVSGAAGLYYDDYCGNGVRPFPKVSGSGAVGGGVIVIINGQYPSFNQAALAGAATLSR